MINGVKNLIAAVDEFEGSVELAHEVEEALLEDLQPVNMPSVKLLYGPNEYEKSEEEIRARQQVDKKIIALLYCEISESDSLEEKLVNAVIGYINNAAYDHGLDAENSITVKIEGKYCVRRILFSQTTRVVKI